MCKVQSQFSQDECKFESPSRQTRLIQRVKWFVYFIPRKSPVNIVISVIPSKDRKCQCHSFVSYKKIRRMRNDGVIVLINPKKSKVNIMNSIIPNADEV